MNPCNLILFTSLIFCHVTVQLESFPCDTLRRKSIPHGSLAELCYDVEVTIATV